MALVEFNKEMCKEVDQKKIDGWVKHGFVVFNEEKQIYQVLPEIASLFSKLK